MLLSFTKYDFFSTYLHVPDSETIICHHTVINLPSKNILPTTQRMCVVQQVVHYTPRRITYTTINIYKHTVYTEWKLLWKSIRSRGFLWLRNLLVHQATMNNKKKTLITWTQNMFVPDTWDYWFWVLVFSCVRTHAVSFICWSNSLGKCEAVTLFPFLF